MTNRLASCHKFDYYSGTLLTTRLLWAKDMVPLCQLMMLEPAGLTTSQSPFSVVPCGLKSPVCFLLKAACMYTGDVTAVNPIMAVTQPSEDVTTNPMMAAADSEQGQAVRLHDSPPMMFNPLVTRGNPTPATPQGLTSPISSEPILADAAVIVPVVGHLAAQRPTGEQPQPPAVSEIQPAVDDSSPELTLASIQTPRNAEVNPRDRTRVKPLSGGNNGPVPTALARAQSGGSPAFLGFGRVSASPKKSLTDLARKVPSRPGSEASGSRRNSPAASPYASPAASRQSSPTRRPSRRSSPANSRANSPTKGRSSRPSSPGRAPRAPSDLAHRPPKQPVRPAVPAVPAAAATAVAAATLVPAQSVPPSDSWIDPQVSAQASVPAQTLVPAQTSVPAQNPNAPGQQARVVSQQAHAADSAAAAKPFGAAASASFPPAKARAAALRQEQESQAGQQQRQQPLSVSSHISRSVKEKAAMAAGVAALAGSSSSSSAPARGPGLAVKAPKPSNPKARVMEDLRAAELARAIAPEPQAAAAPPPDAPPSKLAFGGRNAATGVVEQPRALTAKHFKALARQLEDNKPVEDALAMEASLSLAHLEQNTSMSRRSKGAAPETIAEAEPLQDPRAAADGGGAQQDPMQSPFAAAAQGRFTPRMSAEDMTAMAMGAIDRIRGRAQQPDELPLELGPPRPDRGAARSLSLPKHGSSEDLSAIALAAIARLRNMADKAKESPRSSSAPRPERVPHFETEQERSARLHLPSGPAQATPGPAGTSRSAKAQRNLQKSFSKPQAVRPTVQQSGAVTPATPATPDRLSPDAPVTSTPPSRSWSPENPESTVISAAEVAAAAANAAQPSGPSLAQVISTPRTDRLEPQHAQHAADPAGRDLKPQRAEQPSTAHQASSQTAGLHEPTSMPSFNHVPASEASDSGSDTSGSITAPPRQLVASRVVNLPSQPAAPPRSVAEVTVPSSPSTSSTASSVAQDEEPYVFDEAAAAAKAKEKGKAVLSQPEIRPVCPCLLFGHDGAHVVTGFMSFLLRHVVADLYLLSYLEA